MRKASNAKLIYHEGIFVGIDFGIAYCYEHEQGCVDIQNAFGVDRSRIGIEGYQITKYPDEDCTLEVIKFQDKMQRWVGLYFDTKSSDFKTKDKIQYYLPRPLSSNVEEICLAWDSESFGIVVHNSKQAIIDELMSAIKGEDLVLKMGSGATECDGGFCVLIASRIPQRIKDEMRLNDLDNQKLFEAATNTGIAEYLQKHKKNYYSLKPAWIDSGFESEHGRGKTKYKVVFFLNPYEQYKYNCGWFTVEELKDWAKDRGPVCRSNISTDEAIATLKDALLMEQSVILMVDELKEKIEQDIKSAEIDLPTDDQIANNEIYHAESYYSSETQSKVVAKKLKAANTATELLSRIDLLVKDGFVRIDRETIELNTETLLILREYLAEAE